MNNNIFKVKRDTDFSEQSNSFWGWEREDKSTNKLNSRSITFQVTDDCSLACSYCYQGNKNTRVMSLEIAKKAIDNLIKEDDGTYSTIILDFIGGEPFLQPQLIMDITDYWEEHLFLLQHRWLTRYRVSICSNGMHYDNPLVQKYLKKYEDRLSFTFTIDGNKDLHDSARLTPSGEPSYDIVYNAAKRYERDYNTKLGSKITIAPSNLLFLFHAIKHYIEDGATNINANCVFEEGWTYDDGKVYYELLKRIADFIIDNEYYKTVYFSRFDINNYKPMTEEENNNWCGGTGAMLAVDPDGYYYPCLRYMESSVGDDQPPYRIGDVDTGVKEELLEEMRTITRRSQSTDECFNCPIAHGCAWCSAYNYQLYGTPNKRATFICPMHKAEALANKYYWSKLDKKENLQLNYTLHLPKEIALQIVSEEEYNLLQAS